MSIPIYAQTEPATETLTDEKIKTKPRKKIRTASSDIDILELDEIFIDRMKNLCFRRKYSNYENIQFEKYQDALWISGDIINDENIPIVICVVKNANNKVMSSGQYKLLQEYRVDFQRRNNLGEPAKTIICYFDGIYHESYKIIMKNRQYYDLIQAQVVYVDPFECLDSAISITKLSNEEKQELFAELKMSASFAIEKGLKVLYSDRYISQYFGFKSGDVIKILLRSWSTTLRPVELADGSVKFINYFNTEVDYRIVKNPSTEEVDRHKDYIRSSRFDTLNNTDKREIKLVSVDDE